MTTNPMGQPLRIEATLENLSAIRDYVEARARSLGVAQKQIYDILIAVDEAATNIVMHGYNCEPGLIEIEMALEGDALVARLHDQAPRFDPTTLPLPDLSLSLEDRVLGGMGVYLMRRAADEIHYRALPGGGNELTLVIRLEDATTVS